jgi:hypothetical protein
MAPCLTGIESSSYTAPMKTRCPGTEYPLADRNGGQPCTDGHGMPRPTPAWFSAASSHEHPISPSQDYQWREPFLAHAAQAFEAHQHARTEARSAQENARLKTRVGELTLERNTSDERGGSRGGGRFGSCRAMRSCCRVCKRSNPTTRCGAIAAFGPPSASSSRDPSIRSGVCGGCGHPIAWSRPTPSSRPSAHQRVANPAPPCPRRGGASR